MRDMRSRLITLRQIVTEAGLTVAALSNDVRFFETGEGTEHFMYLVDGAKMPDVEDALLGGISINRSRDGSWGVGSVCAVRGYGPLMYRLAMEWVAENGRGRGLTRNTEGETSPAAARVWDQFDALGTEPGSGLVVQRPGSVSEFTSRTGELKRARVRWVQLTPVQVDRAWGELVDLNIGSGGRG